MTSQFFGLLSAAALAATSVSATSETRSSQSLPVQNLAMVQGPASPGKFHNVSKLDDATPGSSDETSCERDGGHWDNTKLRCRHGSWWLGPSLLIGAGVAAGIAVAVSESDNNSVSH